MKGVDNGFPPGNQREQTAAWMFLCSLQTNIQATESWSLLISLGVIDITCPLQYSTPPPPSNFSKDQHSSSQKVIWSTLAFNKSTNVQPCVYSPHVKNIRQKKVRINNWISRPRPSLSAVQRTREAQISDLRGRKWFTVFSFLDGIWVSGRNDLYFQHFLSLHSHISIVTNGHRRGMWLTKQLVCVYHHSWAGN